MLSPWTEGISREVYQLLGNVTILPSVQTNLFKEKRKTKARNWLWQKVPFPAEHPPIELYHWVRDDLQQKESPYASVPRHMEVFIPTAEEYEKYCHNKDWSEGETRNLLELAKIFDGRFALVADRFEPRRELEQLEERFYAVQKVLFSHRIGKEVSTEELNRHPLMQSAYSVQSEKSRRAFANSRLRMSVSALVHEKYILSEARRIDERARKEQKERNKATKQRKKELSSALQGSSSNSQHSAAAAQMRTAAREAVAAKVGAFTIVSGQPAFSLSNIQLLNEMGVYNQSSRVFLTCPVQGRSRKKVEEKLTSLRMYPQYYTPFKMPSRKVIDDYDELRAHILVWVEVQKVLEKRKSELTALKKEIADIRRSRDMEVPEDGSEAADWRGKKKQKVSM